MDIRRCFATFSSTMKCETLNGILTFVLGALVVVGVILALQFVFTMHESRTLQSTVLIDNTRMLQTQGVINEAQAYYQKYPDPELAQILRSLPKPATH